MALRDDGEAPLEDRDADSAALNPDLVSREVVRGHRPGDQMVRIGRNSLFRHVSPGVLLPRPKAVEPQGGMPRLMWHAKRILIGRPIPTDADADERLTKVKALAIFSSDALSSVAYATEAIVRALVLAGIAALSFTLPISIAVIALLAIVATSYRQTIRAYPSGGGSYIVARSNLGTLPGLTAAASLLIDYVLTVAVSTAAGVAALTSAFPELLPYNLDLALGAIALIMLVNLRGVRESGSIFAIPTYVFVGSVLGLIGFGVWRLLVGGIPYVPGDPGPHAGTSALTVFLVLSAFAKGCTAMTGTEAISNGVPAFKAPEAKNASTTLAWMAVLLGAMFLGISFLTTSIGLIPSPDESETVMSQLARLIVGEGPYYYVIQFSTALILFLASNTSYNGFPRLLSILARDRFAPRWFALRGDRLAFTFGIVALTALASVLLIGFGSSVEKLLPLYAVGVFTSFTLSQTGMVLHWLRGGEPNRMRSMFINGLGAVTTALVMLVIAWTKFAEGAWMVIVIAAAAITLFLLINRHYTMIARQLRTAEPVKPMAPPMVLVPVSSLSLAARAALSMAQGISKQVVAVHVGTDPAEEEKLKAQWQEVVGNVPLVIIESPYRMLIPPLLAYVDALRESKPSVRLLVLLPEFVPSHWWEHVLHNQTALRLKAKLLFRRGVAVMSVPYHLGQ